MKRRVDAPMARSESFKKTIRLISDPLSQEIFTASFDNNRELVEELLKRPGANINVAIKGAAIVNVAIKGAAIGNHRELVEELLNRSGAEINAAILGAAQGSHRELVEDLLKHGAEINAAIDGAARANNRELLEDLLKRSGVEINAAIRGAAWGNNRELLEDLLKRHGAKINEAIIGAIRGQHLDLLEDLLKHGAEINTAVQAAAMGNHRELLEDLLKRHGAKINEAIIGAAQGNQLDLLGDLLKRSGAHIKSAVSGAIYGRHFDLALTLIHKNPESSRTLQSRTKSSVQTHLANNNFIAIKFVYSLTPQFQDTYINYFNLPKEFSTQLNSITQIISIYPSLKDAYVIESEDSLMAKKSKSQLARLSCATYEAYLISVPDQAGELHDFSLPKGLWYQIGRFVEKATLQIGQDFDISNEASSHIMEKWRTHIFTKQPAQIEIS